ncbi:hypothetical protein ACJJIW_07665 [Microbulbifer sp. JMSA004]|uniref:hypothetical protein n=1 Tax=unclassified Microbulbifer TaxID=2619833 RepID=UPI0024AD7790|nr:hypothetical protein [Microbulbifer sp. VAAF005]WHI45149.1 hypothetical protein P0078_15605 [Microbulbifer sp. VAAF005]
MKLYISFILTILTWVQVAAAEEITTLESTVIGSQEQPKVLYIIPWKQADSLQRLDSVLPQTFSSVFEHQEYSEFRREIKLLQTEQEETK